MKIMILGSGAREYSIALALRRVDKNLEFYLLLEMALPKVLEQI